MSANCLICSCDKTIPLGKQDKSVDQLCRAELDKFKSAMPDMVACTQESALFREIKPDIRLVNIRETAGWSDEGHLASAKIEALIEMAKVPLPPVRMHTMESKGVALIYGGEEAMIAARKLSATLDVTVILSDAREITPLISADFPVMKGKIMQAKGVLGSFSFIIDDYALPLPSSRTFMAFGQAQKGITATCDIFIDLSGGTAFFPHYEVREGYLRAAKAQDILFEASGLVGTFDKPIYISYTPEICAHSRSKITGCTKCLDLCPTGAITPAGDHVSIDAGICAGCGACAAACPTGAATYAYPTPETTLKQIRAALLTYKGKNAHILFHDEAGFEKIAMLARFGRGLPAHVIPVLVNEVSSLGYEIFTGAFAYGVAHISLLTNAKHSHDYTETLEIQNGILEGLGYGANLVTLIETDDPDDIRVKLDNTFDHSKQKTASQFLPLGSKRQLLELTMKEVHRTAPEPVDLIALAKGAPFGKIEVDTSTCTLCLACVSACPASALSDNTETPMLRFTESLCVQCGICAKTCPEKAITLTPQIDFVAWSEPRRILNEAEPFNCIKCAKPFGTKAVIDKMQAKLKDHWMFAGANSNRLNSLMQCDSCRIETAANEGFDPYAAKPRPNVITNEDYS
jgi:ferredoxin